MLSFCQYFGVDCDVVHRHQRGSGFGRFGTTYIALCTPKVGSHTLVLLHEYIKDYRTEGLSMPFCLCL